MAQQFNHQEYIHLHTSLLTQSTDIAYFTFAPTLCYQVEYPRTPKIRKLFLLRRIGEAVSTLFAYVILIVNVQLFFSLLILAIVEQYIIPLVRSSVEPVTSPADLIRLTERLLKLSIPNLYVWLLGFYVFFHLVLNILAELLQFGDRYSFSKVQLM
jgi:diacylglycerol O-acyltransferase-1